MLLELLAAPPWRDWDETPASPAGCPPLPMPRTELRATGEELAELTSAGRWDALACAAKTNEQRRHCLLGTFDRTEDEARAMLAELSPDRACRECRAVAAAIYARLGSPELVAKFATASPPSAMFAIFRSSATPIVLPAVLDLLAHPSRSMRVDARRWLKRFFADACPTLLVLAGGGDPAPLLPWVPRSSDDDGETTDPNPSLASKASLALALAVRMGKRMEVIEAQARTLGIEARIAPLPLLPGKTHPEDRPPEIVLEGKTLDDTETQHLFGLLSRMEWSLASGDATILRDALAPESRKMLAMQLVAGASEAVDAWRLRAAIAIDPVHVEQALGPTDSRSLRPGAKRSIEARWPSLLAETGILHPELRPRMLELLGAQALDPRKTHVRKAAAHAFTWLAEELDVDPATLDDKAIPTFGLDACSTRKVEWGKRQVAVRVTPHLDLELLVDGKKSKTAPSKGPAASKKELEGLRKDLELLAGGLAARVERWMRDRQRWSIEDFRVSVLGHPVVLAVARGFVWGSYADDGGGVFPARLERTMRIAEDGTLANEDDDRTEASGMLGIVHAAELDEATRMRWTQIMADYELLPIVPQLEAIRSPADPSAEILSIEIEMPKPPVGWTAVGGGGGGTTGRAWERTIDAWRIAATFDGTHLEMRARPRGERAQKWTRWGEVDAMIAHEALVDLDAFRAAREEE